MMNLHQPVILTDKIPIGISLCCMGGPVRNNGKGFGMLANLGRENLTTSGVLYALNAWQAWAYPATLCT